MVTQHNDIVLALTPLPGLKDFADGAINPAQGAQRRARRGATPMTEYVVADEAAIDHRHTAQHGPAACRWRRSRAEGCSAAGG